MKYRIVTDCSCGIFNKYGSDDLIRFINYDKTEKHSSNVDEWINAFNDADIIFCIITSSALSNSFDLAMQAKKKLNQMHPNRKVYIIDTLSTGPKLSLVIEKLCELIKENIGYREIRNRIVDYTRKTHLMFSSKSVEQFIKDNKTMQKLAELTGGFGEWAVGQAGYNGTLDLIESCQNMKAAVVKMAELMKEAGYRGGKAIVAYAQNEELSLELKKVLLKQYNQAKIEVMKNDVECACYAAGGILVGFER